jgi:signal transduction histidine kinase
MQELRDGPPGAFSFPVLRRFLAVFVPSALLIGGVVLALYYQDRANEESLHEQAGAYLVDLNADIITRELRTVESDVRYLAGQASLRRYLEESPAGQTDLQDDYLVFCRQRAVYDQIRYIDADGRERVRVNFNAGRPAIVIDSDLQPKADRYYFVEAMRLGCGEIFVSPFDLNVEHSQIEQPLKPTIRFAMPIFDGQGIRRGVIVLNYLGDALLRKLAEVSQPFAGTVVLLNREGYFLRGPAPEQEWGFMLGHGRTFAANYPAAWVRINEKEKGQFRTEDGLFTHRTLPFQHGATNPVVGDAGLIVVSYTPPAVLEGQSARLLRQLVLLYSVIVLVLVPFAWYLAYVGSLRRAHESQIEASEVRLRSLSAQLIATQEEERRGISRDLHDELGQVVTSVTLDLERAGQAVDADKKNELIGRALRGAGCLLDRIHEISTRVRPTMLDDLGLKDAVQSLLTEYERSSGIVPKTELRFDDDAITAVVSENVYRILQEALTNVSRHARSSEVFVRLNAAKDCVALTVCDAGVGFDPTSLDSKRLGILGMRERAELLGGTFAVKSDPGKGTEIHVVIPFSNKIN